LRRYGAKAGKESLSAHFLPSESREMRGALTEANDILSMTENQHWVPKFLIKYFADIGRVFCLDIHTDEVTKPPPKHAASERGFNDFNIDGKIISFEGKLQKIETKAAPVLKRIIKRRSLEGLSEADRRHIADFVAAQTFRTKAFYEGLADKPSRQDFGRTFEHLWSSAFFVADEIALRHWALMVIGTEEVFYLGDNPVVLQRTKAPKDGSNLGFDVEGVEAFMPLSPKCALYMPSRATSREIIGRYNDAMALHRTVRSAIFRGVAGGHSALRTAQTTIRRCHHAYEAFTAGVPLSAITPYIENLNYLQCSWSERAIYSNRKDFTFARRVFRENPQYRGVPRTSVMQIGSILVSDEVES
jgi:hypothetical protein